MTGFEENQSCLERWLWIYLASIACLQIAIGLALLLRPAPPPGLRAHSPWKRGIVLLAPAPLPALLRGTLRMRTQVTDDGIEIRHVFLIRKRIAFSAVKAAEAVDYHPILDYRGWGIKWSWRNGWAYTISGHRGARLTMTNGRRILIGSQRPEDLARAITEGIERRGNELQKMANIA